MRRRHSSLRTLPMLIALLSPVAAAGPALAAAGDTDAAPQPTWERDVAPILAERCVSCHRPGDIAPMSLRTYDEVRPWVKSIRRAVDEGEMPPWHADPAYGAFANDRRLSEAERDTIVRWIKRGAPREEGGASRSAARGSAGAESAAPAVAAASEGRFRLGEPDLEIQFDAVDLPAGGPDQFHDLAQSYPLEEDRWVRAVEIGPGDRRVVHHVIVYVIEEGQQAPNGWLAAWAAGMEPMVFPEGTGRLLRKGSRLVADMHYHPADTPARDQTSIGLHFLPAAPEKELVNLWIQNSSFKIPAGAENHEVRSSYTFRQDSVVHALLPHMHYRGKDFTYTAVYPDGRREILLRVPAYDFNWQTVYQLTEPLELPEGTRIECVAHYDNSTKNAANPDPTKDVTFGNESFDEMMIGFVDYTVKDGLRPMSAEERLAKIRAELVREHAPEVFTVRVWEDEPDAKSADTHGVADHVGGGPAAHTEHGERHRAETGGAAPERAPEGLVTALHFPAAGGEGLWFIPFNGDVLEAKLTKIAGDVGGWSATLVAPFGSLAVEGRGGFGGAALAGTITMGDERMGFEGAVE